MTEHPILLIEDDANDVFFFRRAAKLTGLKHPLMVVSDGRAAVDYLTGTGAFADRVKHPMPSLVVLDLNLPHKHGFDVLKWIRQTAAVSALPVVVLTSSNSELDVFTAYRLGANSYFVKPSDPDRLVEWFDLLQRYWLEWARVAGSTPAS